MNGVKKGVSGSSITAYGEGLQRVKLGYQARFDINPHIADHGSISVIVKGLFSVLIKDLLLIKIIQLLCYYYYDVKIIFEIRS